MTQKGRITLTELENMIPWERLVMMDILSAWLEKENDEMKKANR